ncbi:MAG: hypothetical protein EP298_04585 [Gammaproteobacteria bacterium]|nr:MAG: hypothetical protein EP298_04585 [Gammaproteobacteria bacterium]UTW42591.1 hypothetical protein KFE69_00120 [bacterium SCSIO 12844]
MFDKLGLAIMCFSASASFTAGTFLIPIGVYCVYSAFTLKRYHYIMFAFVPIFFGIQQLIEGGVWLALATSSQHWIRHFSVGFVFFSHFWWPFWIPLAAYFVAKNRLCARAWIKLLFAIVGALLGLIAFIPYLINEHMVQTNMCASSIQYSYTTIYDALLGTSIPKYMYIAIIIIPLLISRDIAMKIFGLLILLSVIATYLFYSYAFNSVWCFFSAIISMYTVYLIRRTKDHGRNFVIKETKD